MSSKYYRTKINEILKYHLYPLEYTKLDHDLINTVLKERSIRLIEFISIGGLVSDILELFGWLEEE